MKDKSFADAYGKDFIENWSNLTRIKKPIIAAVNGFAVSTQPPTRGLTIDLLTFITSLAEDVSWP